MSRKRYKDQVKAVRRAMKTVPSIESPPQDMEARAHAAQEAHRILTEAARLTRPQQRQAVYGDAYEQAIQRFHAAVEAAYPPGFWDDCERLKAGDPAGLTTTVAFLEADPYFFRSGYVKEEVLRRIKQLPQIPPDCAERLRRVILERVDRGWRREFPCYCRLARRVDGPDLRAALRERLPAEANSLPVRLRAARVLAVCEMNDKNTGTPV